MQANKERDKNEQHRSYLELAKDGKDVRAQRTSKQREGKARATTSTL